MPCTIPTYPPRLAADGSNAPISIIADHFGVHGQFLPTHSIPPSPIACQHMAMNCEWLAPPPLSPGG